MKTSKKLLGLLMAACLTFSLAACGETTPSSSSASESSTSSEASESSSEASESESSESSAATEGTDLTGQTITVYSREEGSGTRGAFVELMGVVDEEGNDMTALDANFINSTSGIITGVSGDEVAIGYISLGSLDDTVKAVTVDGVEATAENIASGDYAVARPFNVATKTGTENALVDDFMSFILSDDGQAIAAQEGFIEVETTGAYEGSGQTGTIKISGSTSVSPLMEKLKEAYIAINPDVTIEITSSGSSSGMKDAMNGTVDLGMASRELKDDELAELTNTVIAQDGIAVIVNNNNSVSDMSAEDIKSIYLGEKTEW